MSAYTYIAAFGFFTIVFLTLRDIRIYRRTKIDSYRKGALKGMFAGFIAYIGLMVTLASPINPSLGFIIIFIAIYLNGKGKREDVFGNNTPMLKRILGETTLKT